MRVGLALALALALAATASLADETWLRGSAAYVETRVPAPAGPDPNRPAWPEVARLIHPNDRYDHDVLGGIPPWSVLEVGARACGACRDGSESATAVLPENLVFEDVGARLWDVTGDGVPEIVVVESDLRKGARLAVWSFSDQGAGLTRLAATPFIGMPHRWLAPVGVGDFDGDGRIELAYVDRPHLAKELVLVRLEGSRLQEIARVPGYTAHRIGDTRITSAVRRCADGSAELLLPDAEWRRLLAVRAKGRALVQFDEGEMSDTALAKAVARLCR